MRYEYRVIPAPARGQKAKGLKTPEARFAHAVETVMNDLAGDGWEYLRADTLPSEERHGLTSTTTTFRSLLVFRRPREDDPAPFQPKQLDAAPAPAPAPAAAGDAAQAADQPAPTTPPLDVPSRPDGGTAG